MKRVFVQDGKIYCKDCTLIFLKDGKLFAMDSEENWITTENGSHIKIDENGTVIGGAGGKLNGKSFSKEESGSAETYEEIEIPAMTANPFKEREKAKEISKAREKAWEKVLLNKNLVAAEWTFPNGNTNVLSRSIKGDGWQLSWFNRNGEPFGDTQGKSPIELYKRNIGDFTSKGSLKVSAVFEKGKE